MSMISNVKVQLVDAFIISGKNKDGSKILGLLIDDFIYCKSVRGNKRINIYKWIKRTKTCDVLIRSNFPGLISVIGRQIVDNRVLFDCLSLPF